MIPGIPTHYPTSHSHARHRRFRLRRFPVSTRPRGTPNAGLRGRRINGCLQPLPQHPLDRRRTPEVADRSRCGSRAGRGRTHERLPGLAGTTTLTNPGSGHGDRIPRRGGHLPRNQRGRLQTTRDVPHHVLPLRLHVGIRGRRRPGIRRGGDVLPPKPDQCSNPRLPTSKGQKLVPPGFTKPRTHGSRKWRTR